MRKSTAFAAILVLTTLANCGTDRADFRGTSPASEEIQTETSDLSNLESMLLTSGGNANNAINLMSFNGNAALEKVRPAGVPWDGRISMMCYFEDHHPGKFCGVRAFSPQMVSTQKSGRLEIADAFSPEVRLLTRESKVFYYNPKAQFRGVTLSQNPLFKGRNGNPYRCNNAEEFDVNGLNDCYEVMLISFRSFNNDFQNGALMTSTARVVVKSFEFAGNQRQRLKKSTILRAKMHSDWIMMRTNGRQISQWEPSVTADGRLLFVREGQYLTNNSRATSLEAFARSWSGPRDINQLTRESADFKERYPIARRPLLDAAGRACPNYPQCGGQYPWISPGGEDLFYTRFGINVSRGIGLLVVGASTNYIEQYIDGAPNINRYTWVGSVNALAGMTGSLWFPFEEATAKSNFPHNKSKFVYPIVAINGYSELDLQRYTESYDLYLTMSEMMTYRPVPTSRGNDRYYDGKTWTNIGNSPFAQKLTPDISGNFNTARLNADAHFPNEYMESVDRSVASMNQLNGMIGRGVYLAPSGAVQVAMTKEAHNPNARNLTTLRKAVTGIHVHIAAKALTNLSSFDAINLAKHGSAWRMFVNKDDQFCVSLKAKGLSRSGFCSDKKFPLKSNAWTVYSFNITPAAKKLRISVNGISVESFELTGYEELVAESAPIIIGPAIGKNNSRKAIMLVDEFGLSLKSRSEEFDQLIAGYFLPADTIHASSIKASLPAMLKNPKNGLSADDLWIPAGAVEPIKAGKFANLVELGEQIFVDDQLTGKNISCATCHNPKRGFIDTRKNPDDKRVKLSRGFDGRKAERHTPTLLNRAWSTRQMADGSATSLTDQVLMPIINPNEMAGKLADVVEYLRGNQKYAADFTTLFGRAPNKEDLATALATYLLTAISDEPEMNQLVGSRVKANLTGKATRVLRGQAIFNGKGGCVGCHSGPNLSDESFHNTGLSFDSKGELLDLGRSKISRSKRDVGAIKTPGLHSIKSTAPFMSQGQIDTLAEVIDFYNNGGRASPNTDVNMRRLRLTNDEQSDLLEFLNSL
jgi:cytochrome c peroxidase